VVARDGRGGAGAEGRGEGVSCGGKTFGGARVRRWGTPSARSCPTRMGDPLTQDDYQNGV
jgi:hypothetical protein